MGSGNFTYRLMNRQESINVGLLTAHVSRKSGGVWQAIENLSSSLSLTETVNASIWGLQAVDTDRVVKGISLPCQIFRVSGPESIGFAPSMLNRIKNSSLDLVHTHGAWMYPSYASYRWGRKLKKPVIISPHGMLDDWALQNSRYKKMLTGLLYETSHLKMAHCLHALCREEAIAIRNKATANPICIIPNSVNLPSVKPGLVQWIQEKSEGRNILLFLGRLHPKKGLDLLLNALARMKRCRHEFTGKWVLFIAGDGDRLYRNRLEKYCTENELTDNVHFIGNCYDKKKAEVLAGADAFILPSYSEGLPVSVLEAWSYGLPCILSSQCNLGEGFSADAALQIGLTIDSVTEQLGNLCDMGSEQLQYMGRNGLELVKKHFNGEAVSRQMVSLYEWVLGGGQPPACVEII